MLRAGRLRGYIMAVAMVLGGVSLLLLLRAGLSTGEFTLYDEEARAQEAQDATLALQESALAQLMYAPDWHEGFSKQEFPNGPASARMTFASRDPLPWSLNNVDGKKAEPGWDTRVVPPGFAHLVSRGLSPDPHPENPFDDGQALPVNRQSLVQVYRRYWLEDFRKNQRDQPRHEWTFSDADPKHPSHLYRGGYLVMGGFGRTDGLFAEAGESWWEDYDLEAEVAYYGNRGFGFLVRSDGFDGYAALVSPVQGRDACVGASVQFFMTGPFGRGWVPFSDGPPDATLVVDGADPPVLNPFLTQGPEYVLERHLLNTHMVPKYTLPPGFWRIRLSVQDHDPEGREDRSLALTVVPLVCDPKTKTLAESPVSRTFTVPQPATRDYPRGRIGFFCEPDTVVGLTRVRVLKRGQAMVTVPSTWTDR